MNQHRSAALRFTLVASAVALAGLSEYFVRNGELRWAVAPLVVAVGCLTLSTSNVAASRESPTPSGPSTRLLTLAVRVLRDPRSTLKFEPNEAFFGSAAAVLAALLMTLSLLGFGEDDRGTRTFAWYSFGSAVLLLLGAILLLSGAFSRLKASGIIQMSLRAGRPWVLLFGILVLAAGLRLYNLEDIPAGLWFDEADNLVQARHYARNPGEIPVYAHSTNLPSMFLLPVTAVAKLAGLSVTSGRLVATGFGVAGVLATFLFTRHLAGTRAALIAALLVAVMRWDLNWSRIGMHGISGVLFAALTGWLTLRAIRTERTSDYALAGASLGLGMWFYASLRMFPLVIMFILVHHVLASRPEFRGFLVRVAVMGLVALFVAAPVVQFAIDESDQFFSRARETSVFTTSPRDQWADQIGTSVARHSLMFSRKGDPNPRHNLPDAPMLDFGTGALFTLGFFFALTQWRNTAVFTLPFWVFLMFLPGVLTVPWEAPQSLRSILVVPAVAALAAYVFDRLWAEGRNAPRRWVRRMATPVALAALAVIAYINVDFYFGEQAADTEVYAAFSTDETLIARSQVEQQRLGHTLWVSRQFVHGVTVGLVANFPKVKAIDVPETLPFDSTAVWEGASVYFDPRERGFWEVMRAYYPEGQFESVTSPGGGDPLYYSGFVSVDQVAERQGLDVTYYVDGSEFPVQRHQAFESAWRPKPGSDRPPDEVRMEGSLHILEPGEYELMLDANVDTTVEIDGRRVLEPGSETAKIVPAIGLHSISITGITDRQDSHFRVLWKPPGLDLTPIPFSRLYRGMVRPVGLAGRFFEGTESDGLPVATRTTPTLDLFYYRSVLPGQHTALLDGFLHVKPAGEHRFRVSGSGLLKLSIDGLPLAQHPPEAGLDSEASVQLNAGPHRISIELTTDTNSPELRVLWAPAGGSLSPIPIDALTPDPDRMLRVIP